GSPGRLGRRRDDLRGQLHPTAARRRPAAEGSGARPRERLRPVLARARPLMRWLLLKDLQLLRRSPLVTGLLILYPIVLAILIGLAISRGPEKPRVAFLNQIPQGSRLRLGETGGFSQEEARRRLCAKVECVPVSSRAEVEQKVKDGDVLGGLILPADFLSKLQAELSTSASAPAKVQVLVNEDDPLKAQVV